MPRGIGRATCDRLARDGWAVCRPRRDGKAAMSADIPLGRVGTVHDVAALLTFLMSEDAGYITAATYDVNGGLQIP